MLSLGLETDVKAAFLDTLTRSHRIRVTVDVLDRNEEPLRSLVVRVVDGALTMERAADITRSLRMTVYDPDRALHLDSNSPGDSALFADNLLAVRYGVHIAELDEWVDVPIFHGPLTKLERSGALVEVEAQGKEAYGLDPHFATQGYSLPAGARVDNAIRAVLRRIGEERFDLPVMAKKLPRIRTVDPEDEPWDVVKFGWEGAEVRYKGKGKKRRRKSRRVEFHGLASLQGSYEIFYNGRGQVCARKRSRNPVYTFSIGQNLVSEPHVSWDALASRNHVVVTGAKITVGKKPNRHQVQLRKSATLQATHPLSPSKLGRNGERRFLTEFVTAEGLKTEADVKARANRILSERVREGTVASFEALPVPFLEEGDTIRLVTDAYTLDVPLGAFTLPLTPGPMTVGS